MELKEIQDFIRAVAKTGVSEVDIEVENLKLSIKNYPPKDESRLGQTETTYIQQVPVPTHITAVSPVGAPMHQTMQTPVQHQMQQNISPENQTNTTKKDETANYVTIKSPMVGTFYRKPSPDKPPYASVGDNVEPGKIVCIIEAMKLFNEIESEVSGKIVKILVEDSSPVEFDQPLFLVDPS